MEESTRIATDTHHTVTFAMHYTDKGSVNDLRSSVWSTIFGASTTVKFSTFSTAFIALNGEPPLTFSTETLVVVKLVVSNESGYKVIVVYCTTKPLESIVLVSKYFTRVVYGSTTAYPPRVSSVDLVVLS